MKKIENVQYIYIAGKITPKSALLNHAVEYLDHVRFMCLIWSTLVHWGYSPFCPAFDLIGLLVGGNLDFETEKRVKNYSMSWLRKCDTLVLLPGWEQSSGAQAEYEEAKKLGLKIFTWLEFYNEHQKRNKED